MPEKGAFCTNCGNARASAGGAGARNAAGAVAMPALSSNHKKIILIAVGAIILLAVAAFAANGIGGGPGSSLVGNWIRYNETGQFQYMLEMRRNGRGTFNSAWLGGSYDFTWEAVGEAGSGTIVIRAYRHNRVDVLHGNFEVVGSSLILNVEGLGISPRHPWARN